MREVSPEKLREVIARNAGAVISLPSAGMLRHLKTRFLGADEAGFWIQAPPEERMLIEYLMAQRQQVGMSIKANPNKIVFTTLIQEFQATMRINQSMEVDALRIAWPNQLVAIQRRQDYRVAVPMDADLQFRTWRIPEHHVLRDRPLASTEISAVLRDLSVGGMAFFLNRRDGEPPLVDDQRLRITLSYAGGDMLIEGRVKHMRTLDSGLLRVGVQFRNLENNLDGRQTLATLNNLVGELQRDEIKRIKRESA